MLMHRIEGVLQSGGFTFGLLGLATFANQLVYGWHFLLSPIVLLWRKIARRIRIFFNNGGHRLQ